MYFGENRRGARNTGDLVIGGIFIVVPLLLIAKQPDLGTAVTLLPVFLGVAYLAGPAAAAARRSSRSPALLLAPVAWKFALKDYQKSRIDDVPRSRSRIRAAPATSRFRRASPSDRAA